MPEYVWQHHRTAQHRVPAWEPRGLRASPCPVQPPSPAPSRPISVTPEAPCPPYSVHLIMLVKTAEQS